MLKGLRLKAVRAIEKLSALRRSAGRIARPTALLCTGLFAVSTVARTIGFPNQEWWRPWSAPTLVLIAMGLVTAVWQVFVNRDQRRRKRQSALDDASRSIAAHIDTSCPGLELRDVGVHVWVIAGPPWDLRLDRGGQFLLRTRQPAAIVWTKGKGIIGLSWEKEVPLAADLEAHFSQAAQSEAQFSTLSHADRLGLAWAEYQRTRRYKAIWAAPLFDRTKKPEIRGVVSVDIQESGQYRSLLAATQGDTELQAILGVCEAALAS